MRWLFSKQSAARALKNQAPNLEKAPLSPDLHKFRGGLHLAGNKHLSAGKYSELSLPSELVLPLAQHIGSPAEPIVKVGDYVKKNQLIARAKSYISAPIHAPASGTISQIGEREVPHASGLLAPSITITPDGLDISCELVTAADFYQLDRVAIRNKIRDLGIVGLGGAAFPSAVKLNPSRAIDTLIINAAECEPYITCDELLLELRAAEVLAGVEILLYVLACPQAIIAIEDSMPKAWAALNAALAKLDNDLAGKISIKVIPSIYPTGGEKQLIKVITGLEVPSKGLPADIGIVCQNVATTAAIYRAVVHGEPLTARLVTVTGSVKNPQNILAPFGTPIYELIAAAGGYQADAQSLIMGGPMMGFALASDAVPIVKASNCILVQNHSAESAKVEACIRCGSCAEVCPINLLPQQLYWYSKSQQFERANQDFDLFDCIECGCCAYVCPSHIPLVQYYRYAKTEIRNLQQNQQKAEHAKARHDFRLERLEREQREKAEALEQKRKLLAAQKTQAQNPAQDAIAAAVERAKARKASLDAGNNQQAEIAAAVERAKARKEQLAAGANNQQAEIAAAVERAKARKEQLAAGANNQQAEIAAAVERAKARKEQLAAEKAAAQLATASAAISAENADLNTKTADAAQNSPQTAANSSKNTTKNHSRSLPATDPKQAAIAAAKARALAKQQAATNNETPKQTETIDPKQAAIAAAKARALAKQQAAAAKANTSEATHER